MLMRYALGNWRRCLIITLYGPAQRLGVITFNLGKHRMTSAAFLIVRYAWYFERGITRDAARQLVWRAGNVPELRWRCILYEEWTDWWQDARHRLLG